MIEIIVTTLEIGLIYSLVSLALFISYSVLNIADLSTDGCFTLGCAVAVTASAAGHPLLGIVLALVSGVASGFITAFLQTKLKIESILAGIIVNTALYTVNLGVMGFRSNVALIKQDTLFSLAKKLFGDFTFLRLCVILLIVAIAACAVILFLRTRLGLSIRATGDSPEMVKASSINPAMTITVGLCISGALCALAGGLLGQYNKFCDINLGIGMVTIALASLLIGEAIFGKKSMPVRVVGAILGSCVYRAIISAALSVNISAEYFKLVSAVIVAAAIALSHAKGKRTPLSLRGGRRDA